MYKPLAFFAAVEQPSTAVYLCPNVTILLCHYVFVTNEASTICENMEATYSQIMETREHRYFMRLIVRKPGKAAYIEGGLM